MLNIIKPPFLVNFIKNRKFADDHDFQIAYVSVLFAWSYSNTWIQLVFGLVLLWLLLLVKKLE